jgi:hypothetical protein
VRFKKGAGVLSADDAISKMDKILNGKQSALKYLRVDKAFSAADRMTLIRMRRTEFGVQVVSVGENFERAVGVPAEEVVGKYLHHILRS